ncbi:hypothetical protein QCA50_019414 [Cerrena zonata]|uniref:Uncharacterized protein n=1 Tax=Cerrena zonata TaxID=2478898 RepID=A0AAW0F9G4_9APHY
MSYPAEPQHNFRDLEIFKNLRSFAHEFTDYLSKTSFSVMEPDALRPALKGMLVPGSQCSSRNASVDQILDYILAPSSEGEFHPADVIVNFFLFHAESALTGSTSGTQQPQQLLSESDVKGELPDPMPFVRRTQAVEEKSERDVILSGVLKLTRCIEAMDGAFSQLSADMKQDSEELKTIFRGTNSRLKETEKDLNNSRADQEAIGHSILELLSHSETLDNRIDRVQKCVTETVQGLHSSVGTLHSAIEQTNESLDRCVSMWEEQGRQDAEMPTAQRELRNIVTDITMDLSRHGGLHQLILAHFWFSEATRLGILSEKVGTLKCLLDECGLEAEKETGSVLREWIMESRELRRLYWQKLHGSRIPKAMLEFDDSFHGHDSRTFQNEEIPKLQEFGLSNNGDIDTPNHHDYGSITTPLPVSGVQEIGNIPGHFKTNEMSINQQIVTASWLLDYAVHTMCYGYEKLKRWLATGPILENCNAVLETTSALRITVSSSYQSRIQALPSFNATNILPRITGLLSTCLIKRYAFKNIIPKGWETLTSSSGKQRLLLFLLVLFLYLGNVAWHVYFDSDPLIV